MTSKRLTTRTAQPLPRTGERLFALVPWGCAPVTPPRSPAPRRPRGHPARWLPSKPGGTARAVASTDACTQPSLGREQPTIGGLFPVTELAGEKDRLMPLTPRITTLTVPTLQLEALQAALYSSRMTIAKATAYVEAKLAAQPALLSEDEAAARVQLLDLLNERKAEMAAVTGLMNQIKVLI